VTGALLGVAHATSAAGLAKGVFLRGARAGALAGGARAARAASFSSTDTVGRKTLAARNHC